MKTSDKIIKLLRNELSESEKQDFFRQLENDSVLKESFIEQKNLWVKTGTPQILSQTERVHDFKTIWNKVSHQPQRFVLRNVMRYAAIAIVAVMLSLFAGMIVINKQELMLSSLPGQQINVSLPDGSSVFLNGRTSLTYNPLLFAYNREVNLSGEAFFDIKKDNGKKFVVQSENLEVEVLGTRFNVCNNKKSDVYEVVLEEGKVRVNMNNVDNTGSVELNPGEKIVITKETGTSNTSRVNTLVYTSWTQGFLFFKDTPLKRVTEKLEQHYNIEIEITDKVIENFVFSTTIKNESFEQVISLIQEVLPAKVLKHNEKYSIELNQQLYKQYTQ
uniref:FecR family protein n=1 Tax=uncultured Draconibacterium sp. TaxID=1573823 RepID=UPI003216D053